MKTVEDSFQLAMEILERVDSPAEAVEAFAIVLHAISRITELPALTMGNIMQTRLIDFQLKEMRREKHEEVQE